MSAPAMKVRPSQISTTRFDGGIGAGLLDALDDAVAHRMRQRVHGRRVQSDDRDAVFDGQVGHGVDCPHRCVSC